MSRTTNRLKPLGLDKKPEGLHADGANLYLQVVGNSRTWIFRYKRKG